MRTRRRRKRRRRGGDIAAEKEKKKKEKKEKRQEQYHHYQHQHHHPRQQSPEYPTLQQWHRRQRCSGHHSRPGRRSLGWAMGKIENGSKMDQITWSHSVTDT